MEHLVQGRLVVEAPQAPYAAPTPHRPRLAFKPQAEATFRFSEWAQETSRPSDPCSGCSAGPHPPEGPLGRQKEVLLARADWPLLV
jgi:hypothetical protein